MSHEFLLLGVRSKAPFRSKSHKTWFVEPRTEHSAKPERVRELIEEVSPGPHLELFARKKTLGWTVWGNQVGCVRHTRMSTSPRLPTAPDPRSPSLGRGIGKIFRWASSDRN